MRAPRLDRPAGAARSRRPAVGAAWLLGLLLAAGGASSAIWLAAKRDGERRHLAATATRGDPDQAPRLLLRFGCAGCHRVPGMAGPGGLVGPPLDDVARRLYLAGMLSNTPDNLVRWIRDPRGVNPKTAMPVTGISESEARDVAAYLLSR